MSEIFHATLTCYISVVAPLTNALHAGHVNGAFYSRTNQIEFCYPLRMEGRPGPWVEMLLTTTTAHGRLQLQVERSVLCPLSYNVTHRQARKN